MQSNAAKWLWYLIPLLAVPCGSARAQDRQILSREEVRGIAEGRQWIQRLSADGSVARWEIKSNGNVYATYKGGGSRNQMATFVERGIWTISDAGQFCVEWRGSKWPSPDQCLNVARRGEAYVLLMSKPPGQDYADFTVE